MKQKLLKLLPILALMLCSSISFAQLWTPVFKALDTTSGNRILSTSDIRDFSFFDENRGIVSYTNKYHLTTNGGALWSDSGYVQYFALLGLCYVDSQTIFGYSGNRVIKSVNGGSSFSLAATPTPSFGNALIKVEGRFGLAAGQSCGAAYSNNGGTTWTRIPESSLCNSSGGGPYLTQLDIIDSSIGFIAGESGNIFKTTDVGATWSRVTPPIFGSVPGTNILGFDFIDEQRGFIIQEAGGNSGNSVYKTANGGTTWSNITPPPPGLSQGQRFGALFAQDSTTIYVTGDGVIYKSINGGVSYTIDESFNTNASTRSFQFKKFQRVGNTLFLSTANGGNSSNMLPKDPGLTRIFKRNLLATANGLEKSEYKLNFSIAPNPTSSLLTIQGIDYKNIASLSIFSIDGKLIKTLQQPQLIIDVADLNTGLYFVRVETKEAQAGVAKFLKQ
jgi:hypothetical protein